MIDAIKFEEFAPVNPIEVTEEELLESDPEEEQAPTPGTQLSLFGETDAEEQIAELRAREQEELRNAIPNIADYPDTYADVQGNMPDNLYAIYKPIYDKYDLLITSASTQPAASNLPGSETKINIYAGTGENAELSNFAVRPFSERWDLTPIGMDFETLTFNTVEGAFQASKILYSTNLKNYDLLPQFQKASGVEARALGKQVKELDTKTWDANSPTVMKNLLKQSFEQNPDALAKLLTTGNAELTHTQDRGKWGTEFPRLLMEVRNELRTTQPTSTTKNFNKKNLFTVTPIQTADKKAVVKASIATQFIGFGEGITGSSTETYRQQAGALANTGNYSADDVIFVSVPGKRGTEIQQKTQQDRTIKEAIKAVEAGATILTDNKAYIDSNKYNTGEQRQ
jgi:predicted NAD-dependent protein-ADP-ribosyltransferase YbiA (DUF1768 family)